MYSGRSKHTYYVYKIGFHLNVCFFSFVWMFNYMTDGQSLYDTHPSLHAAKQASDLDSHIVLYKQYIDSTLHDYIG